MVRRNNREIQERVAENRRQTRKIDTTLVEVSARNERTLTFTRNFIEVDVQLSLETRDLNDTLISGHPDEQYGSGRGRGGDLRGEWVVTNVEVSSNELVRSGRRYVRDSLDGQPVSLSSIKIGTGDTPVFVSDDSLEVPTSSSFTTNVRDDFDTIRIITTPFLFQKGKDAQEVGLFDEQGSMIGRVVTEASFEDSNKEYRPNIQLQTIGNGIGDSVFTADGITAIVDAIEDETVSLRFNAIAFGSGEAEPEEENSSLEQEVAKVDSENDVNPEQINVSARLFRDEPANQPVDITEVGVFDTQDRLIWRTLNNKITKNENIGILGTVGFNVQSA